MSPPVPLHSTTQFEDEHGRLLFQEPRVVPMALQKGGKITLDARGPGKTA